MKSIKYLISLFLIFTFIKIENGNYRETFLRTNENINYTTLYDEIIQNDIKFPEVVFAQAIIETGHLTSDLFKNENNLFGMKFPTRRETTSIKKSKYGYASYMTWMHSVYDYKLWQNKILSTKNMTEEEYIKLLGRVYAEDKNYTKHIKSFIKA
jgi:uncharacterized FlgJ-related protein